MAISRLHVFSAGEVLLASDLNSEFNNILTGGTLVGFPLTQSVSFGGFTTYWDVGSTIGITGVANGISLTGGAFNTAQGADIASASTINLDTATGNTVDVTGTTTITAITLSAGRHRYVRFTGALTLTNGASLVLPTAANIVTVSGDYALFIGYGGGVVRCANYAGPTVNAGLIKVGADTVLPSNGYNISGPSYGGAIELRANTSTTSRGFRLGVRDTPGTTFTPHITFLDSDPTIRVDCGLTSSSPTLGIGYATGAGGTVTQTTNIGTAVTLNTMCGKINCVSTTYTNLVPAGNFIFNNSNIVIGDVILFTIASAGNAAFNIGTTILTTGSCTIFLLPLSGNGTFTVAFNFAIIKAVAA